LYAFNVAGSRDSVVSEESLLTCRFVVRIPAGTRYIFSSPKLPDLFQGPTNLLFNGYRCTFLGLRLLGREDEHSPPSSAEVKNEWR